MKGDELDVILDEALATYSLQEPRAGLPGRVMARVMARVHADRAVSRGRWVWVAAAVALACMAIAMVIGRGDRRSQPVVSESMAAAEPVDGPTDPPRRDIFRTVQPGRQTASLPRRRSFPSPAPVTHEEQALLTFARQAPQVALQLSKSDKPLEIEAIEIRPLHIDGLPTGETK